MSKNIVNTIILKIFNYLGYNITKKKNDRPNLDGFLKHVTSTGFEPETIVDVGVGRGTPELYQAFPEAYYIFVEPIEEFRPILEQLTKRYNGEYHLAAAGSESGSAQINMRSHDLEGSSIFKHRRESAKYLNPREVDKIKIDDLVADDRQIDILKVDTQGAELEILNGARSTLNNTELVILEVQLYSFSEDMPVFYDVIEFMNEENFAVYDFFGGYNRPLDNALAAIDVAFVKQDGLLGDKHTYSS